MDDNSITLGVRLSKNMYKKTNEIEDIRDYRKEYRENNKEKAKEYQKQYREKNREKLLEQQREWYKKNLRERTELNQKKSLAYYYKKRTELLEFKEQAHKKLEETKKENIKENNNKEKKGEIENYLKKQDEEHVCNICNGIYKLKNKRNHVITRFHKEAIDKIEKNDPELQNLKDLNLTEADIRHITRIVSKKGN
jgi:hypothetical protein